MNAIYSKSNRQIKIDDEGFGVLYLSRSAYVGIMSGYELDPLRGFPTLLFDISAEEKISGIEFQYFPVSIPLTIEITKTEESVTLLWGEIFSQEKNDSEYYSDSTLRGNIILYYSSEGTITGCLIPLEFVDTSDIIFSS